MGAPHAVAEEFLRRLGATSDICLHRYDLAQNTALLVEIGTSNIREASFLDDRILKPTMRGTWIALGRVLQAVQTIAPRQPLHFIFHTGHVGSTLVSRLLDETKTVFPLREPAVLRQLAETFDTAGRTDSLIGEGDLGSLTAGLVRLWARGDATSSAVVLKATSSAGRIASKLLAASAGSRAIYLNLRAEPYIATLVAGQNATADLRGHGPERFRRLAAYGVTDLPPLHRHSKGELAAASWLAETLSQYRTIDGHDARVVAIDFDAFLNDVSGHVEHIVRHFGIAHGPAFLANVGASPTLTRYAKAPEHEYSPALRGQILTEARKNHGEEIRKGLAWLEAVGAARATVAAVLARTRF